MLIKQAVRHRFYFVFYVLVFSLLFACASAPANKAQQIQGLLWKIESKDLSTPSYLFGTMHSEDSRVTRLDEPVKQAFDNSTQFVLEVELDSVSTKAIASQMYFTNGQSLEQVVGPELYDKALTLMTKRGIPQNAVAMMKPWAVFTILNMPDSNTGEFLDAVLYKEAKSQNKAINGLETLQEQVDVFDGMDVEVQIELLRSTLNNKENMDKLMDETIEIYLRGDLEEIFALNDQYLKLLDPKIGQIFTQRLLLDRNKRMTERMIPLLQEGKTFVAVGALHLPGDEGIIRLLENQGFQLTPIH